MANNRRKMIELAEENGYKFKSQKGSHRKYQDDEGNILIIPITSVEVTTGMVHKIERDIRNNATRKTQRLKRN